MLQNRLAEQAVSQLIKSSLAVRFPVKNSVVCQQLCQGEAVLAKPEKSSVEVHKFQEQWHCLHFFGVGQLLTAMSLSEEDQAPS